MEKRMYNDMETGITQSFLNRRGYFKSQVTLGLFGVCFFIQVQYPDSARENAHLIVATLLRSTYDLCRHCVAPFNPYCIQAW